MKRCPAICALLIMAAPAFAQFQGRFSVAERTYPAGDRSHHVVATFTLKNVSGKPMRIGASESANPCRGYSVEITAIRPKHSLKPGGILGSCPGPNMVVLAPGETHTEKVDVTMRDYSNFLDTPGDYRVRLVRQVQYFENPAQTLSVMAGSEQTFSAVFVVHMTRR
jgi:hypothetical protein